MSDFTIEDGKIVVSTDKSALIIGNSDGIGLALTRRLLDLGWTVRGISRSDSPIKDERYSHSTVDVTAEEYSGLLAEQISDRLSLCVYCPGIGEEFDFSRLDQERQVFEVNLMGGVKTIEKVLPAMVKAGQGHIIVLSSMADELVSAEAPSYSASKAALSLYVEGLALAVRDYGVAITNLRFGFVDTKMAKGDRKPFMMSIDRAVQHLLWCVESRPIRYTRPRRMALLVKIVRWATRLKM